MRSTCRRRNRSGCRIRIRIRSRSSNRSGSNRSCSRSSSRGSSWLTWRQGLDALQMQRCLFSLKVFLGENALGVVVPQLQKQSTNRSIVHCAVQMLARGGRKLSSNHRDRTDMMCIFVLFCFSVVMRAVSLSSPREPLILLADPNRESLNREGHCMPNVLPDISPAYGCRSRACCCLVFQVCGMCVVLAGALCCPRPVARVLACCCCVCTQAPGKPC